MAEARELLAESQMENMQLYLIYDDVTMVASAIQLDVAPGNVKRVTITGVVNGFSFNFTMPENRFNETIPIPLPFRPTGVERTTRAGTTTIDWGFTEGPGISFSFRGPQNP